MPSMEVQVAQGDIQVAGMEVVVKGARERASLISRRTRVLIVNDHVGKGSKRSDSKTAARYYIDKCIISST
jgi:hypothetical protein